MTLPGYSVTGRKVKPTAYVPTQTDPWGICGPTVMGSEEDALTPSKSFAEWVQRFGERTDDSSLMYDAAENAFNEGVSRIFTSRTFAANATSAGFTLKDGDDADTLRVVFKKGPGVEGNKFNVAVLAGDAEGEFKLRLTKDGVTAPIETSPSFADKEAAFAWEDSSEWMILEDKASTDNPAEITAQSFVGGTDGSAIADADYQTAIDRFVKDLGPMQVSFPGRTTANAHDIVRQHCADQGGLRFAVLDFPDTADESALASQLLVERDENSRYAFNCVGPWVKVVGVGSGSPRVVPPSSAVAGLMARSDSAGNSANVPAAGDNGVLRAAIGLSQAGWTDDQRETLNDAGGNPFLLQYGEIMLYGYRTGVDPNGDDQEWIQASNSRYYMSFAARVSKIARKYVFKQIDGRRAVANQFGGEVVDLAAEDWRQGSLFGDTPDEAFYIDVSEAVNPNSELKEGRLHLVAGLTMSPFAEMVIVELAKLPIRVEA